MHLPHSFMTLLPFQHPGMLLRSHDVATTSSIMLIIRIPYHWDKYEPCILHDNKHRLFFKELQSCSAVWLGKNSMGTILTSQDWDTKNSKSLTKIPSAIKLTFLIHSDNPKELKCTPVSPFLVFAWQTLSQTTLVGTKHLHRLVRKDWNFWLYALSLTHAFWTSAPCWMCHHCHCIPCLCSPHDMLSCKSFIIISYRSIIAIPSVVTLSL